jgi:hypothetical protein
MEKVCSIKWATGIYVYGNVAVMSKIIVFFCRMMGYAGMVK